MTDVTETRHLFTIGYQQTTFARLTDWVKRERVLLADIRYLPWSKESQWRQDALAGALGSQYLHVHALGNPNYNTDGPMRLADGRAGLRVIAEHLRQQPVVLMCACWNLDGCHRKLAAAYIEGEYASANVPLEVVHLTAAMLTGKSAQAVQLGLLEPPQ